MYVYSVLILNGLILGVAGELGRVVEVSGRDGLADCLSIMRVGANFNLHRHTYIHTYVHTLKVFFEHIVI